MNKKILYLYIIYGGRIKSVFLRYARPQNAHLRQVNSAFSGFASLKLHLFIQPPNKKTRVTKSNLVTLPISKVFD